MENRSTLVLVARQRARCGVPGQARGKDRPSRRAVLGGEGEQKKVRSFIMIFRKALAAGALAALIGGGMVVASTDAASARIVCNQWGRCWHQPSFGVRPPLF